MPRAFFFPLLALSLTLPLVTPIAHATSFGPIPLVRQIEAASYVVHGRVASAAWVMEDRATRRPHTHWKLKVIEVPKGEALPEEITIRQPGGELGGIGYHVAGTATFREGEEVFVNLQDTDEPAIKDVTGLTSGKFSVRSGTGGKEVHSGFGAAMREAGGRAFNPDSFTRLVKRVRDGQSTQADQTVYVNQGVSHGGAEEEGHSHSPPAPVKATPSAAPSTLANGATAPLPAAPTTTPESVSPTTSPQESPGSAEEPMGSSMGWWITGLVLALMAGAAVWLFRRR